MSKTQAADSKSLILTAAVAGTLSWAVLILVTPAAAGLSSSLAGLVYVVGSAVCHQLPERSFHLAFGQMPVCARCAGLYVGGAAGTLLFWAVRAWWRPARWPRGRAVALLALAALPTAATVLSAWLGLGDPSNWWRAGLAFPLGVTAGGIVAAVASDHLR